MGFRRFSSGSRTTVSGRPGMSSGGVSRPHNCMGPGCTRCGETERGYNREVTRPHNCMSRGCTRRGETETVSVFIAREAERVKESAKGKPFTRIVAPKNNYAPDPDPFRFTVTKSHFEGGLTLARIVYHGCTNYEGVKILLLRKDIGSLVALDRLDPHFLETDENGLLARFIPTHEGWELGMKLMRSML